MNSPFFKFTIKLIIIATIVFIIHIFILNTLGFSLFENKIVLSYCVNVFLAIAIFLFLYKMRKKHKDQLGFLFIAGSLLKFAVFFLVFHPSFMLDGDINKLEFASFFIPYLLCLIIETLSLVKWLNKSD